MMKCTYLHLRFQIGRKVRGFYGHFSWLHKNSVNSISGTNFVAGALKSAKCGSEFHNQISIFLWRSCLRPALIPSQNFLTKATVCNQRFYLRNTTISYSFLEATSLASQIVKNSFPQIKWITSNSVSHWAQFVFKLRAVDFFLVS